MDWRINIVKKSISQNWFIESMQCLSKPHLLLRTFTEMERLILKFIWSFKEPKGQSNLKKKKKMIITFISCKTSCNTAVVKTTQYWNKDRHIALWNRIKSPEITLHVYGQMVLDMGAKKFQWGKIISSTNGSGTTGYLQADE